MKTKPVAFLLALTFLFLFSGSVYGQDYYNLSGPNPSINLSKMENAFGDDFQDGVDAVERGDYKTGFKLWLQLAEQELAEAQFLVGNMYSGGHGVPQDYKEAVKWYRLAAEQGDASAQFVLGMCHAKGQGVPQDNVSAHMWWNLAASNGKKTALHNIKIVENKMTASQIEKAHQLVDQFKQKRAEEQAEEKKSLQRIKPGTQKEFLDIVSSYADKYTNVKNEMKRSLQRKKRGKAFKKFFPGDLVFLHWVGTIASVGTDKDGDATVRINIGGVTFSNSNKEIKLTTPLFDKVAEMEIGDKVVIKGRFQKHTEALTTGWYLNTANPTEEGAMTSPIFMVEYSDIKKVNK
jgi:TPR repeat protein